MCQFFSLISDGNGKPYYFDWKQRQKILAGEIKVESPDSHTSIADFYGFKGAKEDTVNKYEYDPFTKDFQVDQLNTTYDSGKIRKFCKALDFKTVVKPLTIKKIYNPVEESNRKRVTQKDLDLLKKWDSVRDSVRDSVGDSVRASVGDSVWNSVGDSVRASVGDSVWDSVRAYTSSFFNIPKFKKYKPLVDLWNRGLVPSFNGKKWRLHGREGKVLWEGEIK